MREIVFTYQEVTGRKCGFVLHAKSKEVSDIILKILYKIFDFMRQNGTVINYSGEIYEQKT